MKVRTLTIKRGGQVDWKISGSYHCGPYDELKANGTLPIRWEVVAECEPKLDGRGFLFDQATLAAWIAEMAKEPTELSCERLVIALSAQLEAWIRRDDPEVSLVSLAVSLSAAPFAATITAGSYRSLAEWKLGRGNR